MYVDSLSVSFFGTDGLFIREQVVRNPTWGQIEAAIRKMDRLCFPYVTISGGPGDQTGKGLLVTGGEGEYSINYREIVVPNRLWDGGCIQHRYYDESRAGDEDITISWGDEIYAKPKHLCVDLDLVLRVVRDFAQTGDLCSAVDWEQWWPPSEAGRRTSRFT